MFMVNCWLDCVRAIFFANAQCQSKVANSNNISILIYLQSIYVLLKENWANKSDNIRNGMK